MAARYWHVGIRNAVYWLKGGRWSPLAHSFWRLKHQIESVGAGLATPDISDARPPAELAFACKSCPRRTLLGARREDLVLMALRSGHGKVPARLVSRSCRSMSYTWPTIAGRTCSRRMNSGERSPEPLAAIGQERLKARIAANRKSKPARR